MFWEVVSLERGPLSLLSTIEVLLGRNGSVSSLETREYCGGIRCADHATTLQKLVLTSSTSGSRSVGIVRSQAKITEFKFSLVYSLGYQFNTLMHILYHRINVMGTMTQALLSVICIV
jgi:hypothetical protein